MVAITLRPGGAPSTPREHHDEALKSEAAWAPFGDVAAVVGVGSYRELFGMPFGNADGSGPGDVCAHKSRNERRKIGNKNTANIKRIRLE